MAVDVNVMSEMECRRQFLERRVALPGRGAGAVCRPLDRVQPRRGADRWPMPRPRKTWTIEFAPPEKTRSNAWSRASPRPTRCSGGGGAWFGGIMEKFP